MVASKQDHLLPKKKFAFKTRKKLASAAANAVGKSDSVSSVSGGPAVLENSYENGGSAGERSTLPANSVVVKDRTHEHLVLEVPGHFLPLLTLMRVL